jgi:nitroreductase
MAGGHEEHRRPTAAVLAEAASEAGYAPSVHNTQPWRWKVLPEALDLYADRSRQLGVTDPDGRLLMTSCGVALHHATVALRAEGWQPDVLHLPDKADPDHLARITLAERVPVSAEAVRLVQQIQMRHTDRRPVSDTPVAVEVLDRLRQVADDAGGHLWVLRRDNLVELASAAATAQSVEIADPLWREEISYWAGGSREAGTGVPGSAIPAEHPQTTVPGRDFGAAGTLPVSTGHDSAASYAVLYADGDGPQDWLRGGETLSAVWLTATELGVSVLPLSAAVEVVPTRMVLQRMLAGTGYPVLVLRLGVADAEHHGAPRTPRLPTSQIVDMSEAAAGS